MLIYNLGIFDDLLRSVKMFTVVETCAVQSHIRWDSFLFFSVPRDSIVLRTSLTSSIDLHRPPTTSKKDSQSCHTPSEFSTFFCRTQPKILSEFSPNSRRKHVDLQRYPLSELRHISLNSAAIYVLRQIPRYI